LALVDAGNAGDARERNAVALELRRCEGLIAARKLWVWHPSRVMLALAQAAGASERPEQYEDYVRRGLVILDRELRRAADESAAESLRRLPFNKALIASSQRRGGCSTEGTRVRASLASGGIHQRENL
jgi:hypothetical protein